MKDFYLHKAILGVIKGIVLGAFITAALYVFNADVSFPAYLALCLGLGTAVSAALAFYTRRQWKRTIAAYWRPAFGEGIDIPNRLPEDEK